jgi:hypothetical protein
MHDTLNIDFDYKHRLAICRPRGTLDEYFTIQLLTFLFALEEVSKPFNRLLDLTLVTDIPLTTAAIQEYADARRHATAQLPQFRTVIIAPGPEAEATARLFSMLMKDSTIEVGIFPNATPAAQWLGVPEDAVRPQSAHPSV